MDNWITGRAQASIHESNNLFIKFCSFVHCGKRKNPPPSGSGFGKILENESKPGCRAVPQRVLKQQVQIRNHAAKLAHLFCVVTGKIVE